MAVLLAVYYFLCAVAVAKFLDPFGESPRLMVAALFWPLTLVVLGILFLLVAYEDGRDC